MACIGPAVTSRSIHAFQFHGKEWSLVVAGTLHHRFCLVDFPVATRSALNASIMACGLIRMYHWPISLSRISSLFSCSALLYSVSQKNPPSGLQFCDIFIQTVENLKSIFAHLLYVLIYARFQTFIQLSSTLTKLCHIKRDYLVHIICSKCPAAAETHAFRRLRKLLIALLIVVCGKSSQICCFYIVSIQQTCWIWYDVNSGVICSVSNLRS